jgi:hypothetical protein
MKGGAWPFLVGGVICLVNSDNERDLDLLNSRAKCASRIVSLVVPFGGWLGALGDHALFFPSFPKVGTREGLNVRVLRRVYVSFSGCFLEGLSVSSRWRFEAITGL